METELQDEPQLPENDPGAEPEWDEDKEVMEPLTMVEVTEDDLPEEPADQTPV